VNAPGFQLWTAPTRKDIKVLCEDPSQTSGPTDEEKKCTDGIIHLLPHPQASFQAKRETA